MQHLLSLDNTTCISQIKIANERRITQLELELRLFKSTVKNCPLQDKKQTEQTREIYSLISGVKSTLYNPLTERGVQRISTNGTYK